MQKRTSVAEPIPVHVVIVTLDGHLAGATERARRNLEAELPGLSLTLHAATEWNADAGALARCLADIAVADIVFTNMLFMEDHIQPVLAALKARRDTCDAMVGAMSAAEVVRLTRMGGFRMDGTQKNPLAFLKRLRGRGTDSPEHAGAQQMAMLRRVPQILRFIPGTAQDVRAYFLTLQYWLAGSEDNVANLVRFLVNRYADGPRRRLRGTLAAPAPVDYPEVGLYHPRIESRIRERVRDLPRRRGRRGRVGLLVMRSYVLAGNTRHYDGVIDALEARDYDVVPAFASGLDARPAVERFFLEDGRPTVDAVVSLTGFSLVGGPAYNDAKAAESLLARLDVPYIGALAVEFQTLGAWRENERGLLPVEATMMVAIPELDGATGTLVYGGRSDDNAIGRDMVVDPERAALLAARVDRLVALRRCKHADRTVAIVLFNFPPNGGSAGTAAHLSVFESLHRVLRALAADGYTVDAPDTVDELRDRVLVGNAARFGAPANVFARIPLDSHVRRERWLPEIERTWGPAPGRQQSDGQSIFVLGERFGNVFVGIQPAFGYEGDPMRLLFERSFAPTHAFSAFYRWIREDLSAHAVLHFGTHGALEFLPGKQVGLSASCWPDRLIQDLPNHYLYAANNPSEGTIAKRRAAATLISYLTPPVTEAGLYRDLESLKDSLDRARSLPPDSAELERLKPLVDIQAAALDLAPPPLHADDDTRIRHWAAALDELESTLIPHGMHVVGQALSANERVDVLTAIAESRQIGNARATVEALVRGATPAQALGGSRAATDPRSLSVLEELDAINRSLSQNQEIESLLRALDGRFVAPAPGGDLLRNPAILPTGRNVHGFDPFRIPSAFATLDGSRQAERLLARHTADGQALPESIAIVLWGTDNLKSEGGPLAQALALIGARARFDTYGRLSGAELIPLAELGRPRVDVVVTLSGIFRDLLPLQTRLLAEACWLAASADEPSHLNFVRKHALAYQDAHGCDLETAALRVFGNADGAYGSNVNHLVDSSCWKDGDEIAETYSRRKSWAYGRDGRTSRNAALFGSVLANVDLAYQNLDSVELGVTTIDHYFDTLGGISRAVQRVRGTSVPIYIGDQTRGEGTVRTLGEQVSLETRTRMLNPKWYEGMLQHGYEGVHQIEVHITNTMGWSATTGQVAPWVYHQLTQTFVLDPAMRDRLAALNPAASLKVANRLLEAQQRSYWSPDESVLEALRRAGELLEDRLEGVTEGVPA
jgi:magnesium chelatase subunit H